jgi:hypothetical protein
MKKLMLCCTSIMLFSLVSFAQTSTTPDSNSTPSSQGTQSASPSMQQPDTQAGSTGMNGNATDTSEKKIKGCVAQQNGQYVLQTKHGKSVPLSGQDVSAHVGHTVALHGMWASSSAGTQTSTSPAGSAGSFEVTKVDMISDSCTMSSNSTGSTSPTPQQ